MQRLAKLEPPWLLCVGDSNMRNFWKGLLYRLTALPSVMALRLAPTAQARHHPDETNPERSEAWFDRDAILKVATVGGVKVVRISLRRELTLTLTLTPLPYMEGGPDQLAVRDG